MRYINLTPHEIVWHHPGGVRVYPPSESVARVDTVSQDVAPGIVRQSLGAIRGLPDHDTGHDDGWDTDAQPGTTYLVSRMVMAALPWRTDLLAPDTGPDSAARDDAGRIIGVKRMICN